ncbi:hypothetical protein KCU71_g5, partial [Aureobasidium melanogenum]
MTNILISLDLILCFESATDLPTRLNIIADRLVINAVKPLLQCCLVIRDSDLGLKDEHTLLHSPGQKSANPFSCEKSFRSTYLIPVFLIVSKFDPLGSSIGMLGYDHIAGEFEYTFWCCSHGLIVELYIPDTRSTILRVAGS